MTMSVPLHRDMLFRAAILLGPLYWLLLVLLEAPELQWDKPLAYPWWFLQLVLLYPVLEELVFRGLLQELVRD
jgi:membrane protease YdiL (CAAX protease family)